MSAKQVGATDDLDDTAAQPLLPVSYVRELRPKGGTRVSFCDEEVDEKLSPFKLSASVGRLSICLTLYNETESYVAASLVAIEENLERLRVGHEVTEVVIALVVDGESQLAPCTRRYLEREGYLVEGLNSDKAYTLHWTPGAAIKHRDSEFRVHRLVFAKRENSGKLHSHWCFYHVVQWLLPAAICAQMDAGTVPEADAFAMMWASFGARPELGALAAKSLLSSPPRASDVLGVFQYASFLDERYILWPRERLSGYLTVLPGQLHMVRWRALAGPIAAALDRESFAQRKRRSKQSPVLGAYFAGLVPAGPVEATAFLAEDRILGLALHGAEEGRWTLGYQPGARALTDGCQSWLELLRQRRRWLCGGTACLARFLLTPGPKLARAHGTWAMFTQILSPALLLTSLYAMARAPMAGHSPGGAILAWVGSHTPAQVSAVAEASAIVGASTLALWALVAVGRSGGALLRALAPLCLGLGTASFATSAFTYCVFSEGSLWKVLTLAGALLAACLSALTVSLYSRRDGKERLRAMPVYALVRHPIRLMLNVYALVNAHDLSWGTKGLSRSGAHLESARGLRWKVILAVGGANCVWVALVLSAPGEALAFWLPMVALALVSERALSLLAYLLLYRRVPSEDHRTQNSILGDLRA